MSVRVVIDKATLKRHRACDAAYTSPEWDESLQALVYADLDRSVQRLLAMGDEGVKHLRWHVRHKLVPMTEIDLEAKIRSYGESHGVSD